jgi:hypothetical protein
MKISLYDTIAQTHVDNAQIIADAHDALDRIGVVREIGDRELTLVENASTLSQKCVKHIAYSVALPSSRGMQAPMRPAGASVARWWYVGGHDDRGQHGAALGRTLADHLSEVDVGFSVLLRGSRQQAHRRFASRA